MLTASYINHFSSIIFLCLTIWSCTPTNSNHTNKVLIKGYLPDVPDGKIYLAQANHGDKYLDSTVIESGNFVFDFKADSSFIPFLASISFQATNPIHKRGLLIFSNTKSNSFYLERGMTSITANSKKPDTIPNGKRIVFSHVEAGIQNKAYVENVMNDIGWLGNIDSSKRKTRIEFFKGQIKKHPYSFFLFESIVNYKSQYSTEELRELKNLFTEVVQNSSLGRKIDDYLYRRRGPKDPFNDILLLSTDQSKSKIFDSTARINMLIFWASWCLPCRAEIPELKKLYEKYRTSNINFVSISMDEDEQAWEKALKEEKMPWKQYIVAATDNNLVDAMFDPTVIPMIIITDKQRNLLIKKIGYDTTDAGIIDSLLNKSLVLTKNVD